jgi:hypothetical protein
MISTRKLLRGIVAATVLTGTTGLLQAVTPVEARAQHPVATPYDLRQDSYIGLGYLANLPNVATGVSAFHLLRGGWGYFVDAKHTLDSLEDHEFFEPDLTQDDAEFMGHMRFEDESAYTSFSAGVIRAVHPEIAVYVGAGYTSRDAFRGFRDPTGEMGDAGGHYYVLRDEETRTGVNLTGGIYIQAGRHLFFRLGGETFPGGVNVGLLLALRR